MITTIRGGLCNKPKLEVAATLAWAAALSFHRPYMQPKPYRESHKDVGNNEVL